MKNLTSAVYRWTNRFLNRTKTPLVQNAIDQNLLAWLRQTAADLINCEPQAIDPTISLFRYGFDSALILQLVSKIETHYKYKLNPSSLWDHSTLIQLTQYLQGQTILPPRALQAPLNQNQAIAIIGMAGRFPGSPDLTLFWQNLINGKDCISKIPSMRWDWQISEYADLPKWGGFIDGIDEFDASFFNISPREAELMDPQQRIFLQTVWHAIEDSGYACAQFTQQKTGLFVGVSSQDYFELLRQKGAIEAHTTTGVAHSILANRVSFLLNLTGPSEAIDTACSSSLVALHRAVRSIQAGDCELAIAGGVNALLTPTLFKSCAQAGMLSSDGRCKVFDESANGYVRSEGVGAIVLKSLAQAQADNDFIYGIIKGISVNHGGNVNTLTAPNPDAQANLIIEAIQKANISPDSISYIETHGTGTPLGDPIEVNGLKKAFGTLTNYNQSKMLEKFCALGSVKSHIGHLEAAAGIAGVIKVLLMLQYKQIPAQIHYSNQNPYIELENSPFYIPAARQPWAISSETNLRRAGVSSFGFGGTNAHVVIEEAPERRVPAQRAKPYYLLTISAKHPDSLIQRLNDLQAWLKLHPNTPLPAIAYSLNKGRSHFGYRCAFVVASIKDFQANLEHIQNQVIINNTSEDNTNTENEVNSISTLLKELSHQNKDDYRHQLEILANLYLKGHELDWELLHQGETRQKVNLPLYPFRKERHWISGDTLFAQQFPIRNVENNIIAGINQQVRKCLADILMVDAYLLDGDENFKELGLDSILGIEFIKRLKAQFHYLDKMEAVILYRYATLNTLINYISSEYQPAQSSIDNQQPAVLTHDNAKALKFLESDKISDIAIIGMSGRFPEAEDIEKFWTNLVHGVHAVKEIPAERWNLNDYYDTRPEAINKTYSRVGGFLNSVNCFDASFFSISPREAELMDPQQRLFLEEAWKALEEAGYTKVKLSNNKCGVYVGATIGDYNELLTQASLNNEAYAFMGLSSAILASRIAYYLDLKGPSLSVDTACSSSLMALHLACESLRSGDCV